jgi:phosphoribosylpyrophosphate synthetase
MPENTFVVFRDTCDKYFTDKVLKMVNTKLKTNLQFSHFWHNTFPDGESGSFPENGKQIRGRYPIIFSCPITDHLEVEMFHILFACGQFGSRERILVMPFLRYRRQDRVEKAHEITRLRWFIGMLSLMGVKHLVICDPHSVKHTNDFCREFNVKLHVADPTTHIAQCLRPRLRKIPRSDLFIYSPDLGSARRAESLARSLKCRVLLTPKGRGPDGEVRILHSSDLPPGIREQLGDHIELLSDDWHEATGKHLIMREDEIATARTATMTAAALRQVGVASVSLVATHPVCCDGWKLVLFPPGKPSPFDNVWLGNTRPRGKGTECEGSTGARVKVINMANVVANTLVKVIKQYV